MANPWDDDPIVTETKDGATPWDSDPIVSPPAKKSIRSTADEPKAYNFMDDMSTFDKVAAGAGKSVVDTWGGLKQLGASLGNKAGFVSDDTVRKIQAEADERAKLDRPLMDTGAGTVGNIAGQVMQFAVPAGALGKVGAVANTGNRLRQAAQGTGASANLAKIATNPYLQAGSGGAAFAASQPVLSNESREGNMLAGFAGGAAGKGVVSGLAALAKPAAAAMSPSLQALAAKAEQAGIPVNAAQLSDSKFVKTLQSTLERIPFTGATQSRQAQQEAFNRAVGETFGESAPAITREVYAGAKKRIGGEFNRLSNQNSLQVSDDLLGKLSDVQDSATRFGSADTANAVKSALDELLGKVDESGIVPGRAYQSFDSQMGKIMKSGGEKSTYIGELREAVRAAMDESISAADKQAWGTARKQYRNLKTVRDLVAKDGAGGDISPALLMGRVNANEASKESMAMGTRGEMGDLAQIGQQFLKDKIPDSGTAGRLLALSALGGLGGTAAYADPSSTIGLMAAAATGGRGMNAAMNSRAMRNYMLQGSGKLTKLSDLMKPLPYVTAPLALDMARQ